MPAPAAEAHNDMPHTIIGGRLTLGTHQLKQGEKGRELVTEGKTKKNSSVADANNASNTMH